MTQPLTQRLTSLKNQIAKTPQLILEIEGLDSVFSSTIVFDLARWDNPAITWDDGVTFWDGVSRLEGNEPLIDLKGSKRTLSQQIRPDKSSTQSVPTFNLKIQDKNNQIAQQLSFDQFTEQLGKKCNVYLNLQGGIHPQDSIPILFGFIDEFTFSAGSVMLSISHASNLQRQGIYQQATTELTSNIDASQTNIPVTSTDGFVEGLDVQSSFLQVGDEIMRVLSSSTTSFTVTRAQLGTQASAFDSGEEILSYYSLSGKPLDIALKLMLSDPEERFKTISYTLESIEFVSPTESINKALIFDISDIELLTGLTQDDTIRITGSALNDGDYSVLSFGTLDDGRSFILTQEELTSEPGLSLTVQYQSKYNILNEGLALEPREVDVLGIEQIGKNFSSDFIDYTDLKIDDSIDNAKEFIEKELFFPQNIYSIPRKARISAAYTSPPLSIDITPVLNTSNVTNVEKLDIKRTIHKYYYNSIQYRYNTSFTEDKFFRTETFLSGQSSRIRTGNSILPIPSKGIREQAGLFDSLQRLSNRLLGRYDLASIEVKNIEVLFQDSLNLEVGDVIPFGGSSTQIPDPQTGKRNLPVALYEVINKSLNIENGRVKLDLVQTGFSLQGVRAVIAPSSKVGTGSTTTQVIVEKDIDTNQFLIEREKYEQYLGAAVRIRSKDYTYDESSFIFDFADNNQNAIVLDPPLSSAPPAGAIFELDIYSTQPANESGDLVKLKFCFTMEQKNIDSVADSQTFDVDNVVGLFEGQLVTVHARDYSNDNFPERAVIDSIAGNTITLESALPFTPLVDYKLETYSFSDGKDGYVIL